MTDYREMPPGEPRKVAKARMFRELYPEPRADKTTMTVREMFEIAARQGTPATFKGTASGRMVVVNPPHGKEESK
jgi:hypothetical protein